MSATQHAVYVAIARSLRDFGYPDVTPEMISEIHSAMNRGDKPPHGIIGMFAKPQIKEAQEAGALR